MMTANTPALPTNASKKIAIDEFWRITHSQGLIKQIRDIPAIPNSTYLVKNGRVFVFDYLVQRVAEEQIDPTAHPERVVKLVDECWVQPVEAVHRWRIRPGAYAIEAVSEGFVIVHAAFEAIIPITFVDEQLAVEAMAELLLGRTLACEGEFSHEQQALVSRTRHSPLLPEKPVFDLADRPSGSAGHWFDADGYLPGFELVDADRYAHFAHNMSQWTADKDRLIQAAQENKALIWSRLLELSIVTLAVRAPVLDSEEMDTANQLKTLYPELEGLSAVQLYQLFEDFRYHPCGLNDWEAVRTDTFGLYLLGKLVEQVHGGEASVQTGSYAWFALLRGDTSEQAFTFAQSCRAYDDELSAQAWYLTRAMAYLHTTAHHQTLLKTDRLLVDGLERRGNEVRILSDDLKIGRKYKVA